MKAKTKRLESSDGFDDRDDPAHVAKGLAYGVVIAIVLWLMAAALVAWLI